LHNWIGVDGSRFKLVEPGKASWLEPFAINPKLESKSRLLAGVETSLSKGEEPFCPLAPGLLDRGLRRAQGPSVVHAAI